MGGGAVVKTIPISGVIGWDVTGQQIRDALAQAGGEDIEVQISSVGGFVFDGLEIFNLIKNYEGAKTARIMGVSASMGSYIPLAADRIIAEANAVVMIHNAWGIAIGDHNDLRKEADVTEGLSGILAEAYVKKTGKALAEIKADMDAETWLFGQETLDYGLVDEVVGTPATDEESKAEAVKAARAQIADVKKLVAEYEGGDNVGRVAALLDVMRPQIKKPAAVLAQAPAAPAAHLKPQGGSKIMTLDQLKAESPEVYAQALALGVQAERDRVAKINAFAKNGPEAVKVAAEAVAAGKSFEDAMPELVAASTRVVQENAPSLASAAHTPAAGLDDEDQQAMKLFGMTAEDYKKGTSFIEAHLKKGA